MHWSSESSEYTRVWWGLFMHTDYSWIFTHTFQNHHQNNFLARPVFILLAFNLQIVASLMNAWDSQNNLRGWRLEVSVLCWAWRSFRSSEGNAMCSLLRCAYGSTILALSWLAHSAAVNAAISWELLGLRNCARKANWVRLSWQVIQFMTYLKSFHCFIWKVSVELRFFSAWDLCSVSRWPQIRVSSPLLLLGGRDGIG